MSLLVGGLFLVHEVRLSRRKAARATEVVEDAPVKAVGEPAAAEAPSS